MGNCCCGGNTDNIVNDKKLTKKHLSNEFTEITKSN